MGTLELVARLNRRHKAALCATLLCVGLILLLSHIGIRSIVGVCLLGIAFSWAIGSNSRLVHWLFVIFGLLLLVPSVGDAFFWPRNKPEVIKDQTQIIDSDRDMVKNDTLLTTEETDRQERRKDQEEERKDLDQLLKDQLELRSLQAESTFRHVVTNDWGSLCGGLLLLSAGLGLLVGIKPTPRAET